jgi:hypothetical protein
VGPVVCIGGAVSLERNFFLARKTPARNTTATPITEPITIPTIAPPLSDDDLLRFEACGVPVADDRLLKLEIEVDDSLEDCVDDTALDADARRLVVVSKPNFAAIAIGLVAQHEVLPVPQHHFSEIDVPSQGVIPVFPPSPAACCMSANH